MRRTANFLHALFAWSLTLAILAYGIGFVAFAQDAATRAGPADPPRADGIVALTGGSAERLRAGVALLAEDKGERLLISGVGPRTQDWEVAALAGASEALAARITYGRVARTTVGNADETARWAAQYGYRSLIVVTDSYHMPRSLLELRAAMPELTLTPYRVIAPEMRAASWWRDSRMASRLLEEYVKFTAIAARETAFRIFWRGPAPPAQAAA
jgi:uncharacterized SAM-binding protein YcdF (DUF218 family)